MRRMYIFEYGEKSTKEDMLEKLRENNWTDVDEHSSYKEIKESYNEMCYELYDDSFDPMYPNGNDHDAEDEDII